MGPEPVRSGSLWAALSRWPIGVILYRWPIVFFWGIVVLILTPAARTVESRLEVAARMPSGQAEEVRRQHEPEELDDFHC